MFGRSDEGQLKALQEQLQRMLKANKSGAAELAAARARCAELEAEAGRLRAEVIAAQASTRRARARQKNSVERANRLKKQIAKASNQEICFSCFSQKACVHPDEVFLELASRQVVGNGDIQVVSVSRPRAKKPDRHLLAKRLLTASPKRAPRGLNTVTLYLGLHSP